MFENITNAVNAHKQIVIAAIAITGLIAYSFPTNMLAQAQDAITITRNIEIPCLPYCDIENEPDDIHFENDFVKIDIFLSFV